MVQIVVQNTIAAAFDAEAGALAGVAGTLTDEDLARPSPCPPWTAADLLCHIVIGAGRVAAALAEPDQGQDAGAPVRPALVPAAAYYRADARFSATANADRLDTAITLAGRLRTGAAMTAELAATCQQASMLLRTVPPDRVVRTRHGDRMLLTDFARTRVVELGLHGLDLAGAVGRAPWLTGPAAAVLEELLLPEVDTAALRVRLGLERVALIAGLTGRGTLPPAAAQALREAGAVPLALG